MADSILHITNGDSLTGYLSTLEIKGEVITWREMLCEGPTDYTIFSEDFIAVRTQFLNVDVQHYALFSDQFQQITQKHYQEIVLWFEYDLFCHINLAAAVSLLSQKDIQTPISLVCSGNIDGSEKLYGLGELTKEQLFEHFTQRVVLSKTDVASLNNVWSIYCSENHKELLLVTSKSENLMYLFNCMDYQLKRFPSTTNGLNKLEQLVLSMISKETIHSDRELIGRVLKLQEFYGFGDLQIEKIIDKLSLFITKGETVRLNTLGEQVLDGAYDAFDIMKDNTQFGGSLKYNFRYNPRIEQLESVV